MAIIIIDCETSGLDPHRHGILEIGVADLSDPERRWSCEVRLREGAEWDAGAQAVHAISQPVARDESRRSEARAMVDLTQWLLSRYGEARHVLAGMNPHFDRGFLSAAAERAGVGPLFGRLFGHRLCDMHTLALRHALAQGLEPPSAGYHTDAIYELLGMEPEPQPHSAIVGAAMEAQAMRRLLGRRTKDEG